MIFFIDLKIWHITEFFSESFHSDSYKKLWTYFNQDSSMFFFSDEILIFKDLKFQILSLYFFIL